MKKPITAALLSALLLPGAGHLYLKHYSRGWIIILLTFSAMGVIVAESLNQAADILQTLQREGGVIDNNRIIELTAQSAQNTDSSLILAATVTLFICWLAGWIDAYRLGKEWVA